MRRVLFLTIVIATGISSCYKEPLETVYYDFGRNKGVFITNEGNFMYGNSSLSFYDKEKKRVYNQVFYARNSAPLGDVAQSISYDGNTLFIVVNNSGLVYGIDPQTAGFKGVIRGLVSPRNIFFVKPGKAYISDLYARRIWIVNPDSYSISGSINVSDGSKTSARHSTEKFLRVGGVVFVSCWSYDRYILIIDPGTDTVIDSIQVPLQPRDMVADRFGKVWVLSDGGYEGSIAGSERPALTRIDPETRTVGQIFRFDKQSGYPSDLAINPGSDTLLFIHNGIRKMAVKSTRLPDNVFIPQGKKLFFSLAIDPATGEVYAADAIDYTQDAMVYRYSPQGAAIDSFRVGINPGGYWFN